MAKIGEDGEEVKKMEITCDLPNTKLWMYCAFCCKQEMIKFTIQREKKRKLIL